MDDLLELTLSARIGKESLRAPVLTFARHVGREGARRLVAELTEHAVESMSVFGRKGEMLREFALVLRDRTR